MKNGKLTLKEGELKTDTTSKKSAVEGRVMHECEPKYAMDKDNIGGYGEAVTVCYEDGDSGKFWVANGEYASRVNFCPYCGEKAPLNK